MRSSTVCHVFPVGIIRVGDVIVVFFKGCSLKLLRRKAESTICAHNQISTKALFSTALGLTFNANDLPVFFDDARHREVAARRHGGVMTGMLPDRVIELGAV